MDISSHEDFVYEMTKNIFSYAIARALAGTVVSGTRSLGLVRIRVNARLIDADLKELKICEKYEQLRSLKV